VPDERDSSVVPWKDVTEYTCTVLDDAFTTIVDCTVTPETLATHGEVTYWTADVRAYVPLAIAPPAGVGAVLVDEVGVMGDPVSATELQPTPVMTTVPPSPPELLLPPPPELLLPPELPLSAAPVLAASLPELLPLSVAPVLAASLPELLPPSELPPPLFPELLLLHADVRAPPRIATAAHRPAWRSAFVSLSA